MNCDEILQKVPTDSGLCCAVNTAAVLRSSSYRDLVTAHQNSTRQQRRLVKIKGTLLS